MTELNVARVGFKHQGVNPSLSDAEKHSAAAHRFLVDTSRDFFGVDFDQLSEVDLIGSAEIRAAIKQAEAAAATDAVKALEYCRDALDLVEAVMQVSVVVSEKEPTLPPIPSEFRDATAGIVRWGTEAHQGVAGRAA